MKKILIIDDEQGLCEMIKKNLMMAGPFEVKTCSDSKQAMMVVRNFQPAIIFLDVMMPGKSGSELAQELRNNPGTASIPVVFLTAIVSESETRQKGSLIGGAYFLSKPVNIPDMVGLVKELTE